MLQFTLQVLNTIGFCVTTLEQLQNWATFAIFPQDEGHSEKYINFVEFKYQCIIEPLRNLYSAIFHSDPPQVGTPPNEAGDDLEINSRSQDQESVVDSLPAGADARSLQNSRHSDLDRDLKDQVEHMTRKYIYEGHMIHDEIVKRLSKNRKDIRILYRWGQASLFDLHDLLDDTLADELYFSVRGKMARILCSMSEVEETADKIEKTLVSQFQGDLELRSYDSKSDVRSDHSGSNAGRSAGQGHSQGHSNQAQGQASQGQQGQNEGYQGHRRSGSGQGHRNHKHDNSQSQEVSNKHAQEYVAPPGQEMYQAGPEDYYESPPSRSPSRRERERKRQDSMPERFEYQDVGPDLPRGQPAFTRPPPVPPLWTTLSIDGESTDSSVVLPGGGGQNSDRKSKRADRYSPERRGESPPPRGYGHERRGESPPSSRGQRSPHSARSASPQDGRPPRYPRPQTAPSGEHESRYVEVKNSRYVEVNDSRYVEVKETNGPPAEFPTPGSILKARQSTMEEDDRLSPERPGHRSAQDRADVSPRPKTSRGLERDPYRPPLQKQDPVSARNLPLSDYPPLPKNTKLKQSSVLEGSAYPNLPGRADSSQRALTDRGDYRERSVSLNSLNSMSVAESGTLSAREVGSGRMGFRDMEPLESMGSTPEPPTSPRPRALMNHPKIVKDIMLQSFSLPNRFLQNSW